MNFAAPGWCATHLPSGTGSRFVREMRDEQRSGELAAAHPHTRFVMTIVMKVTALGQGSRRFFLLFSKFAKGWCNYVTRI